ncbi:MFS transporter [Actinoplanes sp. NPDC051861]|uniref:MFS transporter n=1 Tax=Actinoplanes sp. NPDC051861 TaxID=3155170 RepID=UPI003428F055
MLFSTSVVARLPLATFSIGLLVHVEQLTGSYAAAGAVAGALAVAQGAGGPVLGRLVDRRGQTVVLLSSALVAGTALAAVARVPAGTPLPVLLALATVIGFATPPIGACLRTLIPALRPGEDQQRRAYAVDAAATELTWVSGPPLALALGALAGTGVALTAAGAVLIAATTVFALSPVSRAWRPAGTRRTGGSALASPAMRTLVTVMAGVGVLFGATEVAVAASSGPAAGVLLGLWGVGSLAGGVVAARLGGGATGGRSFAVLLAALGVSHLALVAAPSGVVPAAVLITVAGSLIAPILASAYAMVDRAAPAGTVTEAFAWLATATAVGTAAGAAAGGALADLAGARSGFVLAGGAAVGAAVVALLHIPVTAPRREGPPPAVRVAAGGGPDVRE